MATFKVKQPKPSKKDKESLVTPSWPQTVTIPVSKEMALAAKVDKKCEICLRGTIKSISSREGDTYDNGSRLEVLLSEVELPDGDYDEMADA